MEGNWGPPPQAGVGDQAYACCLVWRWANGRVGESAMLDLLGIGEDAKKLWRDVKLLVEQAWTAHDTRQVIALARQALERLGIDPKTSPLRLPTPDTRPEPHESQGRYSFRQEARTPETPHLLAQSVAEDPRDLALYLLVDRSGSMRDCDTQVSLALMSLYLAAMELEIPTGLAFFGAHSDADRERVLEAVASRESDLHEAGIRAWMGSKSPEALSAYLFAVANGKDSIAAWRAFWNAGRIVSLSREGA
ncbi:MAG: hypothetical protein JXA78_07380, partial [Anaerolineales bacterium]|nr:hypothetical protein [Anaerolineales bacterium]